MYFSPEQLSRPAGLWFPPDDSLQQSVPLFCHLDVGANGGHAVLKEGFSSAVQLRNKLSIIKKHFGWLKENGLGTKPN